MNNTLDEPSVFLGYASVSPAQLEDLARTYDRVAAPVWVMTPRGNCVYRNRPAEAMPFAPQAMATFDVVDFDGQVVACLHTIAHA